MGTGHAPKARSPRAIRRLGLADRVRMRRRYERDREALAAAYRSARCVVMPGELETFGLVAFEAAACGARDRRLHDRAVGARCSATLVHTFAPGDPRRAAGRDRARPRARARPPRRRRASPPPTAGSARSPPSSPTSKPRARADRLRR